MPGTAGVLGTLRPEDISADGLPTVVRGYDRRRVESLLLRASEAYAHTLRQCDALRERARSLEAEVAAAESEARVSAASVAELVQRGAANEEEVARARAATQGLEERLARVEGERAQAVADLEEATGRIAELDARARAFEQTVVRADAANEQPLPAAAAPPPQGSDEEAARLLLAAVRTVEELRGSSRARALHTLRKARARAAAVDEATERERAVLAELQERRREAEQAADQILAAARAEGERVAVERREAERAADEILAAARAEAERVAVERREAERLAAEIGDERSRVRTFLAGALSALELEGTPSENLLADLSSRLPEAGEREGEAAPAHPSEQGQ